jgi:anti-anti-sigma factor
MKFEITQSGTISTMVLKSDRLDSKIAPDLKGQFISMANASEAGHLVLDLGNIQFADSSGLSALLLAHRLFRDSDRSFILCNLSERVQKLIDISQLTTVFTIAADAADAANQISS